MNSIVTSDGNFGWRGTKAFSAEGVQDVWDSTSLKLASDCLRKYYYVMMEGWQSKELSVHLRFGQHYATALEHYHKARAEGASHDEALFLVVKEALEDTWDRPVCETCYGRGEVNITAEFAANNPQYSKVDFAHRICYECQGTGHQAEGAPWESGHNLKTRGNLIRTIVWYLETFEEDTCSTYILSDGRAGVEYSFKLPVDNGVVFSGHIDRLVNYAQGIYVQDQKTTGSTITARYFEGFAPDIQMSMYTFAGKAIYDIPVKGVIIDAAQIAVGFSRFERGFTFRDEPQLNEWYDTMMRKIEETQAATREQYFPMNTQACGNYGGCPFRQVCSRTPAIRPQFLKGAFVQGPSWDPMRSR